MHISNVIRRFLCALTLGAVVSCSSAPVTEDDAVDLASSSQALVVGQSVNAYIGASLEIDQLQPGALQPADANLFVGPDPTDGTASMQVPSGGPATWVDWNDLSVGHRLMDVDLPSGKDPSSFPQSNECVGASNVLNKMDLRYVAAANNDKYAYFGVLRSANNGDAGYYWLFTKKSPKMVDGAAPCSSQQARLLYDVGVGDVLLVGHFKPSSAPLLRVFTAVQAQLDVTAIDAVDFTGSLWSEVSSAVAAVAVNTTVTAPGVFGHDGVVSMAGNNLGAELFAEAAVDLAVFTGNASNCGATYYGSVITRSSGAGGTSPDLKDLSGPALFNFGSVSAVATVSGGCDGKLSYSVAATGPNGQPLVNPTCVWTFDGGANSSSCSGDLSVPAGTHSGTVTVSDGGSCTATAASGEAQVYLPLGISLGLVGSAQECPTMVTDAVTYEAQVTGGTGQSVVAWSDATCSGTQCVIDPADSAFCASGTLQATVSDALGVCAAVMSEVESFSKVTTVIATDN